MRILITGSTYPPCFNGQSIFMGHLAEGLAQKGHQVRALFPSHLQKAFIDTYHGVERQGVRAKNMGSMHVGVYYPIFPHADIDRMFNEFKPEIVHIHDHYPMSVIIMNRARQRGIKVLGTNHFLPENLAPYFPLYKIARGFSVWALWTWMLVTFNQLDVVTAPSQTAADILRKVHLRPPVIPISCGVDLDIFNTRFAAQRNEIRQQYGIPLDKPVIAFVGRVDGEKRLDVILKALRLSECEPMHMLIVGKGAALEEVKKLVDELGLKERVHFSGFIPGDELPRVLNCVDLFTMPSEAELLSIATLEAMGCGLPILAANSRALPELVDPGVNGYLFDPGKPESAAQFIKTFVNCREQWQEMGQASLKKVQSHSIQNTLEKYEKVYLDLIAR
jgi:glycosyltransferase involved in cell wall biosynthesis